MRIFHATFVIFMLFGLCLLVQPAAGQDLRADLYWQRKFIEYLRQIEERFDRTDGNYAKQHFIESYAIRGILIAFNKFTNDLYDLNYAIRWSERMLSLQGETLNPGAYSMGYDESGYERPWGWYTADCTCIGLAVLSVAMNPQITGAQQDRYIQSVKMFADYVIDHWRNPNGSIQTGWRDGQLNPIKEFWIATSLFSELTWYLYDVTKIEKYKRVAMEACDWLIDFNYFKAEVTPGTSFEDGITTFIVYLGEGLITNAEHLREDKVRYSKIKQKLRGLVDLVLMNQRQDGGLSCRVLWWRQKVPAIFLTLDWYYRNLQDDIGVSNAALKILQYTFSEAAEVELQTGIHTQTTTFTFLALAGKCAPGSIFPKPSQ